jgi:hypothetical protein
VEDESWMTIQRMFLAGFAADQVSFVSFVCLRRAPMPLKRALLSVTDKTGLLPFAKFLCKSLSPHVRGRDC